MFPLSDLGVLALTASAPFLAGALTGVFRRRWSVLALLGAAAVFYMVYGSALERSPENPWRAMSAAMFGAIFLIAWLLGEVWGLAQRLLRRRLTLPFAGALIAALLPAILGSGWVLQRQYVSQSCLDGVLVELRGERFLLRPEHAARLAWLPGGSGETWLFYSALREQKDSTADLCRQAENGQVPLAPEEVLLGHPGVRATSCRAGAGCLTTDTSEFRLQRVAEENPTKPSAWFGDEIRDDLRWGGDVDKGWICFLPNGSFTWVACQRWITLTPGLRAVASMDLEAGAQPEKAIARLDAVISEWLERLSP